MTSTLPALLSDIARSAPDGVALRLPGGTLSYGELWNQAGRWATWLTRNGAASQRVGVLLPNTAAFPLSLYGIHLTGGTALLLNPLCAAREIGEYVVGADVRRVITLPLFAHLVPEGVEVLDADRVEVEAQKMSSFEDDVSAAEDAVLIFTAATGGWARAARLTHANLVANLRSTVKAMGMVADDRVLAMLPLIHAFGLTVTLTAPLAVGASVIPVERFHPVRVLDLLETSGATVISGVPAMFGALVSAASKRGAPPHRLRLAICGGAPLPTAVAQAWQTLFGIPLRQGYGLTEAAPVCLFNQVDRPNHIGTMGWPFPAVEVTLRDDGGKSVPEGTVGEICVAGPNVFPGYLGEGGRRPEDFHGDAFRTGDLGTLEPDGAVRFVGLRKAMFTRNGFNIYPREVERALEEDRRISRAAVSAVPNPERENDIALAIRPSSGVALTEEDVRTVCRERLASYKQPGPITIETQTAGPSSSAYPLPDNANRDL